MQHRRMDRAALEGIELEYETRGSGEPVVLIHPGHFVDWFTPLLNEPALTDRYYVIRYHRVGCAGSGHIAGPVSLAQQAAHCRSLMRHLGIERAHIVGHSSGANIALQLALDAPDAVQSLALLEPALMTVPSAHTSRAFVATAIQRYGAGDHSAAVDIFLEGVCGPGYRAVLNQALPGAFDQYLADAGTFFGQELPALQQWSFTREDASRITQPVLAVLGAKSKEVGAIWGERHELLLAWLPNVEPFVLPDAAHLLQVQNPRGMADGLVAFFARHPLSARQDGQERDVARGETAQTNASPGAREASFLKFNHSSKTGENPVIKISILYPNKDGARFDMRYYVEKHMPISIELLSAHPGFKAVSVERGVGGAVPGADAAYVAMCHFSFNSVDDFLEAFMPNAATLQGDMANYTDIEPIIQFNEVLISK